MRSDRSCETLEFLCNSPQRLQILDVLDDSQMDVRDVTDAVDGARSTVQRNLSVLEERRWLKKTSAGYTTTPVGRLLCKEFMRTRTKTNVITRMAPFFEAIDEPDRIDCSKLADAHVLTPEPGQPTLLMNRIFDFLKQTDYIRGLLPVVSSLSVELSRRAAAIRDITPTWDFIITLDTLGIIQKKHEEDGVDEQKIDIPDQMSINIYENDLPYGLLVSDSNLILAAYDKIGRIIAIIESTNDEAIKWGEQEYDEYKRESTPLNDIDHPVTVCD